MTAITPGVIVNDALAHDQKICQMGKKGRYTAANTGPVLTGTQAGANLGGNIYKKRIARANITNRELKALKALAAILLAMDEKALLDAVASGAFLEVNDG